MKILCDRCGKDRGSTYYKININGHPTDDEDGLTTMDAVTQNLFASMSKKHFCNECKLEIKKFINEKTEDGKQNT